MTEPAVALTDFVLAGAGFAFAWKLGRARGESLLRQPAATLLASLAAGAAFGGFHHAGWEIGSSWMWRLSAACLGATSFGCLWLGAALLWPAGHRRPTAAMGSLGLALYLPYVLVEDRSFAIAAGATAPTALFLLIAFLVCAARGERAARTGAAGLAVSLVGSLLQQARVGFPPHFDHNAVYHVAQLVAVWLLFTSIAALAAQREDLQ